MTRHIDKIRQFVLDVVQVRPIDSLYGRTVSLLRQLRSFSAGISFKLAVLIISLLSITAIGISIAVISIMDDIQLQSMIERGSAMTTAVASPAAYNILAEDRLALDNLVSKVSTSQPDLEYLTIIDANRQIITHSQIELNGTRLPDLQGVAIGNSQEINVQKIKRNGDWVFEFSAPVTFNDANLGEVIAGINSSSFTMAREFARDKIVLIVSLMLPLAIAAAFLLARLFTYPVKQLTEGVDRLYAGEDRVIVPITSNDELATLTRSFNEMATRIVAQRQSLVNYSEELEQSYTDIVKILAAALDARDNYTYGHSSRVAHLSVAVGRKLELQPYELNELEMTCLLHDIGKINIPDKILNKPGKLNDNEYQHIKDHPYHGVQILDMTESLKKYIPAVLHHHEWYDGTGYPGELAGNDIPLYARILSIADAYDAMTSSRPYRQGLSRAEAVRELILYKGKQFEPHLVDLFIETLDEYGDVCDVPLQRVAIC